MNIYVNELLEEKRSKSILRVLWVDPGNIVAYVIDVDCKKGLPLVRRVSDIVEDIINGEIVKHRKDPYLINSGNLSSVERENKERAWEVIKDIARNEPDIFVREKRGKLIEEVMTEHGITKMTVYKYLRRYWQRGKNPNALIPDYKNSGGRGKEKTAKNGRIGRKPKFKEGASLINIDEATKKILRVSFVKHYLKNAKKTTLQDAYNFMIRDFFAEDIYIGEDGIEKVIIKDSSVVPTMRQYRYWYKKEHEIEETLKAKLGKKKFEKDHRAILGSSTYETFGPGSRFQIDATIADVYLVSRYNPNWIIGRPVVYLVIDVFSRMVAGLYIGLEGPSWLGAMMAIANTVTDKVEFCKEYGITITKEQWPCEHLPELFLADRGELEGYNIERLIDAFDLYVENAAPYRADWKGIVEKHFDILHQKVKPLLPGYIDTDFRQRGAKDYRLDAKLTIEDFSEIIIRQVISHNTKKYLQNYPRDLEMIEQDVKPCPIELWNWGVKNRSGSLTYHSPEIVKLNLLPRSKATVTATGIKMNSMLYTSEKATSENWHTIARNKGTWKVDVAYDPRNTSKIYLVNEFEDSIDTCYLLEHQHKYENKDLHEVIYLHEHEKWIAKQNEHEQLQKDIDSISETEFIIENAIKNSEDKIVDQSNSAKVSSINPDRKKEKDANREREAFDLSPEDENNINTDVIEEQPGEEEYKRPSIKELLEEQDLAEND
ncbi:DDE-type integrase/transposase/recombinase [Bacillus sp. BHET2]|uniref:Mu transposase C-terminal domain-containing protein n=1 Tax=Bacillus sp. BHET2 TaxID=2583818 RepID=UPI00110E79BA|nr:Mu transposase C-terminal domain-containing protein [Bacillus sp. BHET2]TMU83782.1 DDE-type integrase/transposase/recombinase [Bacillus sp. BHET2]